MDDYPRLEVDLTAKIAAAGEHWKELDALREQHRFFWNTYGSGYWVLTRYDDIKEASHQPGIFSNHSIVATDPEPAYRFLPSFLDPPQHVKYRRLLNWWFAPAAVQKMAPEITRHARETIEPLVAAGHTDFCATFGDQYPVKVFLLSIGLDTSDADFFVSCVRRMSGAITGLEADVAQMMAAWGEVAAYWTDKVADRHAWPLDPDVDIVSHLCRSKVDGKPLPDADIIDLMVTLTLGSLDTLKSQLGWCFYHLAAHPDDRKRLIAEPELIPSAVEEFLRAYPIVPMARKVTTDTDFHGCPMRKGDMVMLTYPSATRDPREFPDADKVILDRFPNRHMAFGVSEHRCLGSHLARNEMQTAIREWHRLIPDYRLAGDEPPLAHHGQISLMSLPLAWD
jgi:cytochrome P450